MPQTSGSSPARSAIARIAASTAYMCFRSASEAVYSCMRARARSRVQVIVSSNGTIGVVRGEGYTPLIGAQIGKKTKRGESDDSPLVVHRLLERRSGPDDSGPVRPV